MVETRITMSFRLRNIAGTGAKLACAFALFGFVYSEWSNFSNGFTDNSEWAVFSCSFASELEWLVRSGWVLPLLLVICFAAAASLVHLFVFGLLNLAPYALGILFIISPTLLPIFLVWKRRQLQ